MSISMRFAVLLRLLLVGLIFCMVPASQVRGEAHAPGLSPQQALTKLIEGNARYANGASQPVNLSTGRIEELTKGQKPYAIVVSCSDSRVPPEHVFNAGLGELFVIRVAGNVVDEDAIASVEYAAAHLGTKLVLVMGHEACGAVKAAAAGAQDSPAIKALVARIAPAVAAAKAQGLGDSALIDRAIELNAGNTHDQLLAQSAILKDLENKGEIKFITATYHLHGGKVQWTSSAGLSLTAPPQSAEAASAAHSPAAHAPAQADNHSAPSNAAASSIVSDGKYSEPKLVLAKRAAFGSHAGTAADYPAPAAPASNDGTLVNLFWLLTAAALGITLAVAWFLSSMKTETGSTRGLTIGTKLTLGFGGLATLLLMVSTLSISAQNNATAASNSLEDIVGDTELLEAIQRDMLMVRMNVKDFLLTNSDEDLKQYSDFAASVHKKVELAKTSVQNPDRLKMINEINDTLKKYEGYFEEVVKVIDTRNGVVDSQMTPAARRATELLEAVMHTAEADGDLKVALDAAECLDHLQLARVGAMRYLRTSLDQDAREAIKYAEVASKDLTVLANDAKNPRRKLWIAEAQEVLAAYGKALESSIEIVEKRKELVTNQLDVLGPAIAATGVKLLESISKSQHELADTAHATAAAATVQSITVSAIALVVAIGVSLVLIRSITTATNRVLIVLRAVACGDLTQEPLRMTSKDEMGELARATDRMSASLTELIQQVNGSALEVASAATEIAASSEEMAQGMSEQTQQVTQISSAIEEMSASVVEVARKSADAANSAGDSGKMAQEGGVVVTQTIEGMSAISQAVTASATSVQELGKRGEQIGQIIEVINDIADQTNLLALNAAIEAARAGEHGRGFAVVADEVRKLADRTTKATEEIAESIKAIQTETTQAVDRMNAGTQQVASGVGKATEAGESLKKIVESAKSVAVMIQSIAAAAEEQSAASEQVSRNVESISAVARQASEGAGQAATAAAQLSTKAEQLQQLVGRFKISDSRQAVPQADQSTATRKPRPRFTGTARAA